MPRNQATAARLSPRFRPATLSKLDQRTKEARLVRETRAALTAHVGGTPSATQRALIEQACQLSLRLAAMDRRFVETQTQTDHDSRTYLAWANSLSRLMRQLGLKGVADRPENLQDYLANRSQASSGVAA